MSVEFLDAFVKFVDVNNQLEARLEAFLRDELSTKELTPDPHASPVEQSIALLLSSLKNKVRGCDGKIVCRTKNGYVFADSIFAGATLFDETALTPGAQKRLRIEFYLKLLKVSRASYVDVFLRGWVQNLGKKAPSVDDIDYFDLKEALLKGPLPHPLRVQVSSAPQWSFEDEIPLGGFLTISVERPPRVVEAIGSKCKVTATNHLAFRLDTTCEGIRVSQRKLLEADLKAIDDDEVLQYLEARSNQGDGDASDILAGLFSLGGRGIKQDHAKAFELWMKSSEQGSLHGTQMAVLQLQMGNGVAKNLQEANRLGLVAAQHGDCTAKARAAYFAGMRARNETERKAFRSELEQLAASLPESPAPHLYWAMFTLEEKKFDNGVFSPAAAELLRAAVHGSLKGLALYSKIIPEFHSSTGPDPAQVKERLEVALQNGLGEGWISTEIADVLRKGSLQEICKLDIP